MENINPEGKIITMIQNNYKSSNYTVESIKELYSTLHFQTIMGMDNHPYFGNSMLGLIFISKFLELKNLNSGIKVVLIEKSSSGCDETMTECIHHNIENVQYWKEKSASTGPVIDKELMKEFINYCWLHIESLHNKDESLISKIFKYK
jgi:hypothetical protein